MPGDSAARFAGMNTPSTGLNTAAGQAGGSRQAAVGADADAATTPESFGLADADWWMDSALPALVDVAIIVGWLVAAAAVGALLHFVLFSVVSRVTKRHTEQRAIAREVVARLRKVLRPALPLLVVRVSLPLIARYTAMSVVWQHWLGRFILIAAILTVTYGLVLAVGFAAEAIMARYRVDVADNLEARRVHTQTRVIERTVQVVIVILGVGAALATFPEVRTVGVTLLASAGVAGIVIGMAAKPTFASLIAGLQIALTQPIRLDDVVIINGEWGRIEEITATYVVVRIWDERRLIVPLSKIIDDTFQNWTRQTAQLLGTVYVYADHCVDVDRVRSFLHDTVKDDAQWDGRVQQIVVTNATEKTVELRALISARNSGDHWDLRCKVREALVRHLRDDQPEALPKHRADISPPLERSASGADA
jgi:small-conductance mechanosensitive channel